MKTISEISMKTMNIHVPYVCSLNTDNKSQTVSSVKSDIKKMEKIISRYDDNEMCSAIENSDLSKLIEYYEKNAVLMRSVIIDRFSTIDNDAKKVLQELSTENAVKLSIENETLRIFLPNLFNTSKARSSYVSDYVKMAFSNYKYENNIRTLWHRFIPPYVFIVKRHVKDRNVFLSDNDNFAACSELNVILNTIASEFLLADDWKNMEYFLLNTSVRVGEKNSCFGTEIILFEKTKENLLRHIDDFL